MLPGVATGPGSAGGGDDFTRLRTGEEGGADSKGIKTGLSGGQALLDAGSSDAFDEAALEDQEDDQDRQDDHRGTGEE